MVLLIILSNFMVSHSALTITNLNEVLNVLKEANYPDRKWVELGLQLGLYYNTLGNIGADFPGVHERHRECLAKWLQRIDSVNKKGGANWSALADAVEKTDQKMVATYIS